LAGAARTVGGIGRRRCAGRSETFAGLRAVRAILMGFLAFFAMMSLPSRSCPALRDSLQPLAMQAKSESQVAPA